jgi:hypothetical protein
VLWTDLANGPLMLLDRHYPDRGIVGPTRRATIAAVHSLVAARQAVVRRGPGWTRVELRRGGQGAVK